MLQDFLNLQASENTKLAYKAILSRFISHFNNKTPEGNGWVSSYITHLKNSGLSNKSINYHMTVIKTFYKKALGSIFYFDRLKVNPARIDPPTLSQVETLIKKSSKEFEPILRFMVDSGVRVGELKWLSEQKFDSVPDEFVIVGKGNKQRVVVVSDETKAFLSFPYLFSRPWTIPQIQYQLRALCKQLGLPHLHAHQLRHYFATTALNNGVNILEIKEMLGHSFLQTTELYTHVTQGRLREVWKKYHSKI